MMTLRRLLEISKHPITSYKRYLFRKKVQPFNFSDEEYSKKYYKIMFGKELNLENPKTFNEKTQWLKLYYRKPIFTTMVDKLSVKDFVTERIGSEYVIPLLGVWDSFDEIDFDKLPKSFVLKENHLSGGLLVCKDKTQIDLQSYKAQFDEGMSKNYYYHRREWPYKNIKPKLIAEEYVKDGERDALPVYKFFCFSGEPYLIQVIQNDKKKNETIDYFDTDWNLLKIRQNFPNSKTLLPKPSKLDEMLAICRKLTKGFPFLRCDLYLANDKVYFSEFTFYSDAGFQPFHPKKWDLILGEKIILPKPELSD